MENIKKEMKKILQRRINHSRILPVRQAESVVKYHDFAGNNYTVPRLCVDLEDGTYEELVAYHDELVLYDAEGNTSAWNIENGEICWG